MIEQIRSSLFQIRYPYDNPIDRQRAAALFYIVWAVAIAGVLAGLLLLVPVALGTRELQSLSELSTIGTPIVAAALLWLIQRGNLNTASYLMVFSLALSSSPAILTRISEVNLIVLTIPIVTAGLLLNWRGIIMTLVVVVTMIAWGATNSIQAVPAQTSEFVTTAVIAAFVVAILTGLLLIFGENVQRLAAYLIDDLRGLQQAAQHMVAVNVREEDETDILARMLSSVRDALGYTYAQFHITDASGQIIRRAYSGLGVERVAVTDEINIPGREAIEESARSGQPVRFQAGDSSRTAAHFLPGIESGLLLPLINDGEVLGVLDIQSEHRQRFNENQMAALQIVATQFTRALTTARMLRDMRSDLNEQQAIINNQRERLLQLEDARRESIEQAWTDYLNARGMDLIGFDIDPDTGTPIPARDLPEADRAALASGELRIEPDGDRKRVLVPIELQGQLLGAMTFTIPAGQPVGQRQIELIRNVVQRLSMALENKRLFEQSQEQARRERKANEVAANLLRSTDVQTVLRLAAENFNDALGAIQTQIHIQPEIVTEQNGSTTPEDTL